jgi:hypothetical protein
MNRTNRSEFKRLILQIERDLLAETHLRTLLAAANTTLAGRRLELRAIESRIKRTRSVN